MEAEEGGVVSGCPGYALHKSRTNPAKDCDMSGALHRLDNVSSMPEDRQGAHICEKKNHWWGGHMDSWLLSN